MREGNQTRRLRSRTWIEVGLVLNAVDCCARGVAAGGSAGLVFEAAFDCDGVELLVGDVQENQEVKGHWEWG